jgi:hypothetical protein
VDVDALQRLGRDPRCPAAVALAGVEELDAAARERAEQLAAEGAEPARRGGPVLVVAGD